MSDKLFYKILIAILITGTVSSFSLAAYTVHLHNRASIITYTSNERLVVNAHPRVYCSPMQPRLVVNAHPRVYCSPMQPR